MGKGRSLYLLHPANCHRRFSSVYSCVVVQTDVHDPSTTSIRYEASCIARRPFMKSSATFSGPARDPCRRSGPAWRNQRAAHGQPTLAAVLLPREWAGGRLRQRVRGALRCLGPSAISPNLGRDRRSGRSAHFTRNPALARLGR